MPNNTHNLQLDRPRTERSHGPCAMAPARVAPVRPGSTGNGAAAASVTGAGPASPGGASDAASYSDGDIDGMEFVVPLSSNVPGADDAAHDSDPFHLVCAADVVLASAWFRRLERVQALLSLKHNPVVLGNYGSAASTAASPQHATLAGRGPGAAPLARRRLKTAAAAAAAMVRASHDVRRERHRAGSFFLHPSQMEGHTAAASLRRRSSALGMHGASDNPSLVAGHAADTDADIPTLTGVTHASVAALADMGLLDPELVAQRRVDSDARRRVGPTGQMLLKALGSICVLSCALMCAVEVVAAVVAFTGPKPFVSGGKMAMGIAVYFAWLGYSAYRVTMTGSVARAAELLARLQLCPTEAMRMRTLTTRCVVGCAMYASGTFPLLLALIDWSDTGVDAFEQFGDVVLPRVILGEERQWLPLWALPLLLVIFSHVFPAVDMLTATLAPYALRLHIRTFTRMHVKHPGADIRSLPTYFTVCVRDAVAEGSRQCRTAVLSSMMTQFITLVTNSQATVDPQEGEWGFVAVAASWAMFNLR